MGERISGKLDGTSITIEGPPGPHKYSNIYIKIIVWSIYEKPVVLIFSYCPCISSVRRCTMSKILVPMDLTYYGPHELKKIILFWITSMF